MANDTIITIVGNLTRDPELRYAGETPVAGFAIASTPRTFDRATNQWKDGETMFLECSVWRELGANAAATLQKGMSVIAQGRLTQRSYTDREGASRTVIELEVDAIGPNLRWATAAVTRAGGGGGAQRAPQQGAQQYQNPYGAPAAAPAQQPQAPQVPAQQPYQQGNPPQQYNPNGPY